MNKRRDGRRSRRTVTATMVTVTPVMVTVTPMMMVTVTPMMVMVTPMMVMATPVMMVMAHCCSPVSLPNLQHFIRERLQNVTEIHEESNHPKWGIGSF